MSSVKTTVAAFRDHLRAVIELHRGTPAMEAVGGNFLIHVPDAATLSVVTAGERAGVYDGATEDVMSFALFCKKELFADVLAGDFDYDAAIAQGALELDGDPTVFQRFMELPESRSALDLRVRR